MMSTTISWSWRGQCWCLLRGSCRGEGDWGCSEGTGSTTIIIERRRLVLVFISVLSAHFWHLVAPARLRS